MPGEVTDKSTRKRALPMIWVAFATMIWIATDEPNAEATALILISECYLLKSVAEIVRGRIFEASADILFALTCLAVSMI